MTLLRKAALAGAIVGAAVAANHAAGKPVPFLRPSVLRFGAAMPRFNRSGQVGDGRELALSAFVTANARRNDIDDVIAKIDDFARNRSFLAYHRRTRRNLFRPGGRGRCPTDPGPDRRCAASTAKACARLDFDEPNLAGLASIARQIWEHAGVAHRITAVVGMIGDSGATIQNLRTRYGFADGTVDFWCSSTTRRSSTYRICGASSNRTGSTPAASSSPTTSRFQAHPNSSSTCAGERGDDVDHRRTRNPRRVPEDSSRTSSPNRSTSAPGRYRAAPVP